MGFEAIYSDQQLINKGIRINADIPDFPLPDTGMWAVVLIGLKPSKHGVATLIYPDYRQVRYCLMLLWPNIEHYYVSNAGAYVFTAAVDREHEREVDLVNIYNGFLG